MNIKNYFFIALLTIIIVGCSKNENPVDGKTNKTEIPAPAGWTLVWNDEFDKPAIDNAKWEHEVNGHGGGNNELQYYTDRSENSFIENGALVIKAIKESYTGPDGQRNFTSARLVSKNKGDWKYGRFDIKAKLPYGQGIWPAIWMMPTDNAYGGWAASGEIDIMEYLGHEQNKVYGTLHYGGSWPNNTHTGTFYSLSSGTFVEDFHVFTLEWQEGEIRWYVDGKLYQTQTQWNTTAAPFPAPFDQKFFMILNLAVGGNWPGNPDATTVFPQQMVVDYVRVFAKAE
ncbi:MAG TPA: glycoside hydrolase family 16 protein [bacterium]|nr:glycoside hydrolase family 16 protein [bacterium]HPN45639.1 glycoside hydrolase family 16 protein [bacterium]